MENSSNWFWDIWVIYTILHMDHLKIASLSSSAESLPKVAYNLMPSALAEPLILGNFGKKQTLTMSDIVTKHTSIANHIVANWLLKCCLNTCKHHPWPFVLVCERTWTNDLPSHWSIKNGLDQLNFYLLCTLVYACQTH